MLFRSLVPLEQGRHSRHAHAVAAELFDVEAEPDQLGPTLDKAIAIVESGKPAVVDVITQPR